MAITPTNRKKAEEFYLAFLHETAPNNPNIAMYRELFASMNDQQFEKFVERLENGDCLAFVDPNGSGINVTTENNIRVGKLIGVEFFERLILTNQDTGFEFVSNHPYMVIDVPARRAAQALEKKVSIPKDDQHVDQLTDQATGVSKGSTITGPELQLQYAQNWDATTEELMKVRGGDAKAYRLYKDQAVKDGRISLNLIRQYNTTNRSVELYSTLLTMAHIGNNLKSR